MSERSQERITRLESAMANQQKKSLEFSRSIKSLKKDVRSIKKTLENIDKKSAIKTLEMMDNRLKRLSSRLRLEILKDTVLSEVSRVFPESAGHLIAALDLPDSWWAEGDDEDDKGVGELTIEDWKNRVMSLKPVAITRHLNA